jgi:hypothetical protein
MNDQEKQARANIHPSTLQDMQRVCGDAGLADIVRDSRAPSGPCSPIPAELTTEPRPLAQPSLGFVEPRPLGPPPGINYVDRLLDAADAKDRQPDQQTTQFMMAMQMAMQVASQTQAIAKLLLEQSGRS